MISKVFNYISTISCVVTIVLLYGFIAISDSFYFNGYIILLFLLMLLNPIVNLCRLNKKIISNPIFHILIFALTTYILCMLINSVMIYINNLNGTIDKSLAHNMSISYFSDKLIYIFIAIIVMLLITFLFKKINIKSNKDNSKIMLLIILITSLMPILIGGIGSMPLICAGFNIALFIFSIIIFFKLKSINTASELRSYYLVLIISSMVSINPIAFVLSIYMFLQLDTFGLHI